LASATWDASDIDANAAMARKVFRLEVFVMVFSSFQAQQTPDQRRAACLIDENNRGFRMS